MSKHVINGKTYELSESEEMYLETILLLRIENEEVRSIDIAKTMDFSKPSVSVAIKKLKGYGLIVDDDSNDIDLTDEGYDIASNVYEKHNVLTRVLVHMGVEKKQAVKDACKMEHIVSDESFTCIKEYFSNFLED